MISTYGELVAAIKTWLDTPFKWERKVKEEIKQQSNKSILDSMFDPEMQRKARDSYNEAFLAPERARQRYADIERRVRQESIPFCAKCKDVGCDECSTWPMNQ
jgi:hypothetical protein